MKNINNTEDRNAAQDEWENAPEGTCPVCWGYQQYDGKMRILMEDKQIDVNNHKHRYMRIQNFLKNYIEGIKLKEGKIITCTRCGEKEKP